MTKDLADRTRDIEWPAEFEPEHADWFSHNELYIEATPERVWHELTAAPTWPRWYPLCDAFEIDGGAPHLYPGAHFVWTTFGLTVDGTVVQYELPTRLSWTGYAPGTEPTFYHVWTLSRSGSGCVAAYDEAGRGPVAISMRDADEADMHRGHDLLLAGLRWAAESPTSPAGPPDRHSVDGHRPGA